MTNALDKIDTIPGVGQPFDPADVRYIGYRHGGSSLYMVTVYYRENGVLYLQCEEAYDVGDEGEEGDLAFWLNQPPYRSYYVRNGTDVVPWDDDDVQVHLKRCELDNAEDGTRLVAAMDDLAKAIFATIPTTGDEDEDEDDEDGGDEDEGYSMSDAAERAWERRQMGLTDF
jgi:hypothetical protein